MIADEVVMGFICQICLLPIDGTLSGHPRTCDGCLEDYEDENR